jgi:hypothetical protein
MREVGLELVRIITIVMAALAPAAMSEETNLGRSLPERCAYRAGALGTLLARAEEQTLRLSLLFASSNGKRVIEPEHLQAAQAILAYSEAM